MFGITLTNFAKNSELGMETSILTMIVAVNVNAKEVPLFAREEFAGFA